MPNPQLTPPPSCRSVPDRAGVLVPALVAAVALFAAVSILTGERTMRAPDPWSAWDAVARGNGSQDPRVSAPAPAVEEGRAP